MAKDQEAVMEGYIYALKHHADKGVLSVDKYTWSQFKSAGLSSGCTLYFKDPPAGLARISSQATVIGVELSNNPTELNSLDVVRLDSKDAPKIYNLDQYKVYESPCLATAYPAILSKYGIEDSPELREQLEDHVLLIGPYKDIPNHHTSGVTATLMRLSDLQPDHSQDEENRDC